MEQPQGLQQIAISADLNDFLLLLAPEAKDDARVEDDLEDATEIQTKDFRIFPTQTAAYRFAVSYALAHQLQGIERSGDVKNKWQTPAIYDEAMAALLELYGINSSEEKHVHYKMIELAEAGLRELKGKAEAGFDLWDLISG